MTEKEKVTPEHNRNENSGKTQRRGDESKTLNRRKNRRKWL